MNIYRAIFEGLGRPCSVNANDYHQVVMLDNKPKPTWEEIEQSWQELQANPPLPASVSKQSLRQALIDHGIYHTAILNAINAIEDEEQKERLLAYYETATTVRIEHPAFVQFVKLMGISEEQKEAILKKAAEYDNE